MAANGTTRMTDLGVAEFTTESGTQSEIFVNVAGFGANGEVARRSNQSSKRFGGTVTFVGATLRTLASYKPQPVRITAKTAQGVQLWEDELLSAFVANGHYCGSDVGGCRGRHGGWTIEVSCSAPPRPADGTGLPRLYNGNMT